MHILLIGSGGREHALAWKLGQSPRISRLSVTGDNPGFPLDATRVQGDPVAYANAQGVDLVVVGPEAPLAEGVSDRLREAGVLVFGPSQSAARLESSKAFAKGFMDRHSIPTAGWSVHDDLEGALAAVAGPCVVKADGLAAGKGVIVAADQESAREGVREVFSGRFGSAADQVVLEELLVGPEVSVLAFCDGTKAVPLLSCRDHKRRFDGDAGPNTGGMGAICPAPGVGSAEIEEIRQRVLQPVVDGMRAEGMPFVGVLYAGLMWTEQGPKVLEFNVRFGDPECQPLMMMMDDDLVGWLEAAASGSLPQRAPQWHDGAACCVVMVAGGYPGEIVRGAPISGVPIPSDDCVVFYAGAKRGDGCVQSSGGRVLGVTARGATAAEARKAAYRTVKGIDFETAAWREDIGQTQITVGGSK